jgi:hypothetical protein
MYKFIGVVFVIIDFILTFIPLWIGILFYHLLSPETFIEKFVTIAAGIIILGSAQVVFIMIGSAILASIFDEFF